MKFATLVTAAAVFSTGALAVGVQPAFPWEQQRSLALRQYMFDECEMLNAPAAPYSRTNLIESTAEFKQFKGVDAKVFAVVKSFTARAYNVTKQRSPRDTCATMVQAYLPNLERQLGWKLQGIYTTEREYTKWTGRKLM